MKRNTILLCALLVYLLPVCTPQAWARTPETLPADTAVHREGREKIPIADYKFKGTHLILPASLLAVGALGIAIDGMDDYHLFSRSDTVRHYYKADDYLEWGMLGWVFVCGALGKGEHSLVDQLFLVGIAEGLNGGMVQGLKKLIDHDRPDGRTYSFPSGHTANAFLGAHIAFKEFKNRNLFLACSGYAVAAFVAASRVYKNRHWMADVVAGAGIGILSVELSYLIYFPIRNAIARSVNRRASDRLVVTPTVTDGGAGLYVSLRF